MSEEAYQEDSFQNDSFQIGELISVLIILAGISLAMLLSAGEK